MQCGECDGVIVEYYYKSADSATSPELIFSQIWPDMPTPSVWSVVPYSGSAVTRFDIKRQQVTAVYIVYIVL